MMKFLTSPRLLLPLIILIGVGVLGLRVGDVWDLIVSGHMTLKPAYADTKADTPSPSPRDQAKEDTKSEAPTASSTSAITLVPPTNEDVSPAEMEILKQLSARRDELDKRAKQLDTREALIKVAEQRVDQKIREMETLKQQLQSMVDQANEAQNTQLDNLVKVYETMKPDEAAHIFETLDMPILLSVIQRMKPKSTAPIMAKMTPEKAKEITVALTKQDQLPQIK